MSSQNSLAGVASITCLRTQAAVGLAIAPAYADRAR